MNGKQNGLSDEGLGLGREAFGVRSSAFLPVFVLFYVVSAGALFARFFWLCPVSWVSLITVAMGASCYLAARNDVRAGLLVLSFFAPLAGSLPHLAPERCPPPLLLAVGGLALGWFVQSRRESRAGTKGDGPQGFAGELAVPLLVVLLAVSGLLTAWRYLNNAPFGGKPILQAAVNVRQETAAEVVGDVWQTLVVMLSGPLVFLISLPFVRDERWLGRWARVFLAAMLLAGLVGLAQLTFAPWFGNAAYWARNGRINATFTDPNALGAFVALSFPLAVALVFGAGDTWSRALGGAVAVLGLATLGGAGSRTGAGGVALGSAVLLAVLARQFRGEGERLRGRVLFATLLLSVAVVAFAPLGTRSESKRWALLGRLARTREVIFREGPLALLGRDRWPLWEPAIHVALRYPMGGIGLGAFRYEMENIARLDGRKWRWIDNANNFYLQTAGELGVLGLALVVAAFVAVGRGVVRAARSPGLSEENRSIVSALATSWFLFLFLLLTAMWLLFEQIQLAFWLFAAIAVGQQPRAGGVPAFRRRVLVALGIAPILVIAGYQAVQAFAEFAPERRRAALGLEVSEGFYDRETDETGRRFRWSGEKARVSAPTTRGEIRIEMRAGNPDLAARPLMVWISLEGRPAASFEITSPDWRWLRIAVPPGTPNPAEMQLRVERAWRPSDFGHPADRRLLGIAVSRIENADPGDPLPPVR